MREAPLVPNWKTGTFGLESLGGHETKKIYLDSRHMSCGYVTLGFLRKTHNADGFGALSSSKLLCWHEAGLKDRSASDVSKADRMTACQLLIA